jgi:hypothetical protein
MYEAANSTLELTCLKFWIESQGVYMEMVAVDRDKYDKVRGICKNSHTSCARLWAVVGRVRRQFGIHDGQLRPSL